MHEKNEIWVRSGLNSEATAQRDRFFARWANLTRAIARQKTRRLEMSRPQAEVINSTF